MTKTVIDLFSGVGGFSYAAEKLGWKTVLFCEKDEFCRKVLKKNFGDVPIIKDIHDVTAKSLRELGITERPFLVCGGPPCQPFSHAGQRRGTDDERHLFPEAIRVVRELQPDWVVYENVGGFTSMALEIRDVKVGRTKYSRTEEIDDYEAIYTRTETMLLNSICEEIEREGYAVQPVIIPAVSLEADHERKRIWIVARRNSTDTGHAESSGRVSDEKRQQSGRGRKSRGKSASQDRINAPDPARFQSGRQEQRAERERDRANGWTEHWITAAARFCRVDDGLSDGLHISGNRDNRVGRLKALGNSIVPQIAYEIFKAIANTD